MYLETPTYNVFLIILKFPYCNIFIPFIVLYCNEILFILQKIHYELCMVTPSTQLFAGFIFFHPPGKQSSRISKKKGLNTIHMLLGCGIGNFHTNTHINFGFIKDWSTVSSPI